MRNTDTQKTHGSAVYFSRDEAAGLAIRVEDAMRVTASLLDGADATTEADDWKRKTLIAMARERNGHLEYVALRLRSGNPTSVTEDYQRLRSGIECAANALTDSILCSGNDAATNMHFVRKLKALLVLPST